MERETTQPQQELTEPDQEDGDRKGGRVVLLTLIVILIALAVLFAFLIVRFQNLRTQKAEEAFETASAQALGAASEMSDSFSRAMAVADSLAEDLSSGELAYEGIEARLSQILSANPVIDGMTVSFAPFAYAPEQRLQQTYVYRDSQGEIESESGEPAADYTLPPAADLERQPTLFYYDPANKGPTWSEPFQEESVQQGGGKVLIQYGRPFYQGGPESDEIAGVVAVDYSLEAMRGLVNDLDLGQTGFGAMFNQSGTWLEHPIPELVAFSTFYDGKLFQEDERLVEAAERSIAGEPTALIREGSLEGPEGTYSELYSGSGLNSKSAWNFFAPIESTGWVLLAELSPSEFLPDPQIMLQEFTKVLLVGGALLLVVLALLFRVHRGEPRRFWPVSLAFAAIVLAIIAVLIMLSRLTPQETGVAIVNNTTLNSYLKNLREEFEERGLAAPIEIPTGVLIQAARFPDSGSAVVNGYVWQRVPKIEGQEIMAGFVLPQIIDEPVMIEEIGREERQDETYVLWSVVATLRQAFDPLEYPFDRHDISIRLLPMEVANNVVLVPDLEAYDFTVAELLPGLESDVRINNWRILSSSFRFRQQDYNTNIGLPGRPTIDVPELTFNITTQRRFLGPFIAFLMPAVVAALMIFAFLLYEQKPDEPEEIVIALSYTAALFFVIAVMHTALRDDAAAIGLTFLEYFYLLLYGMIIFVAINTFIVVRQPRLRFIRYGNNLISKLLFWPATAIVMLIAALAIFVYG